MVENAVGVFALPLGLALNFVVDGEAVIVPMAVEEPSVIAACSMIAKLAAEGGGFTTSADPPFLVGQVQILDVPEAEPGHPGASKAMRALRERQSELIAAANEFCPGLVALQDCVEPNEGRFGVYFVLSRKTVTSAVR